MQSTDVKPKSATFASTLLPMHMEIRILGQVTNIYQSILMFIQCCNCNCHKLTECRMCMHASCFMEWLSKTWGHGQHERTIWKNTPQRDVMHKMNLVKKNYKLSSKYNWQAQSQIPRCSYCRVYIEWLCWKVLENSTKCNSPKFKCIMKSSICKWIACHNASYKCISWNVMSTG